MPKKTFSRDAEIKPDVCATPNFGARTGGRGGGRGAGRHQQKTRRPAEQKGGDPLRWRSAAATIKATARKQGYVVELPDCLIAAVAVRLNQPLVIGNTDDFVTIQKTGINLTIENWR